MPADTAQMRGVFTIPVTPFDDLGDVDENSLRRCVQFCVDAGAHGVVAASGFTTLLCHAQSSTSS
jgi:dihydrodipicolinate synthase/N-acetylneuraminate lyase